MKKIKAILSITGWLIIMAATSTYEADNSTMADTTYVIQMLAGLEMAVVGYGLPEGGKNKWEE